MDPPAKNIPIKCFHCSLILNISFSSEHRTHLARKEKKREMKKKMKVRNILFFKIQFLGILSKM